jgi:hypothetical protein
MCITMNWIHQNVKADVFTHDYKALRAGAISILVALAKDNENSHIQLSHDVEEFIKENS